MKLNQDTINEAQALGFKISDKLEYRTDTDTGLENGERVIFWNVIFPPDYPNQHSNAIHDTNGLKALIRQYKNRFEDARKDKEYSQRSIEAVKRLGDMLKGGKGE
jgi:hypothetical protein